jgi:excisionase family DNA binding protein
MARNAPTPCLISIDEAAAVLSVSPRTILAWIASEDVPFVETPNGGYKLPLHGLVRSLPRLYDLPREFREADDLVADAEAAPASNGLYELPWATMTTVASTTLHLAELAPPVGALSERARAVQRYCTHA